jgi:hypothetical protein
MLPKSNSRVITFVYGLALIVPASIGLLISGVPTILCPFPAVTVLPAFLLSGPHLWNPAVALPTLFFFVWHRGLFRGEAMVPKRSYVLFSFAAASSVAWFVAGWRWGVQYQGIRHVQVVCAVNVAWVGFLGLAFARAWKGASSFSYSLFVHWMLFAWFAWYAFPYLGELP